MFQASQFPFDLPFFLYFPLFLPLFPLNLDLLSVYNTLILQFIIDSKISLQMDTSTSQSRTLWLGDLQPYMDQTYLTTLISQLGYSSSLLTIKIIKDKQTGIPSKYGFLQFNSHQTAQKFLQQNNGKIIPNTNNKYFKIKWAAYGGGVKANTINVGNTGNAGNPGEISIYVGEIDGGISQARLMEYFKGKYPSVYSAKIIVDPVTKQSKGYGFIKFTNLQQSHRAIAQTNGHPIPPSQKPLKVSHAYTKPKQQQSQPIQQQQPSSQSSKMIKIYQQFYSMLNDPILKSTYQSQLLRSTGQQINKKTFKQYLDSLKSMTYAQTVKEEEVVEGLTRVVCFNSRREIQRRIFMG